MTGDLDQSLARIERLAQGSKLARLLHAPLRYLKAIGYWRLIYPIKKKGKFAAARTFFGAEMKVVLPSATEIYLFGAKTHDSEIRLTRFLLKNLRPGDIFADVGAHFGYFSLLAAHLVEETGKVYSFEASPSTFNVLQKNTAGAANIFPLHRAASEENATLAFHEFPVLFSECNSLVLPAKESAPWLRRNPPQRVEVEGLRLDDFFSAQNVLPNLVKIDVEGAELQVLRGMRKLLAEHFPTLVMEYLLESSQQQAHRAALDFAKSLGYCVFLIDEKGETQPCENLEKELFKKGLNSDNIILKKQQP